VPLTWTLVPLKRTLSLGGGPPVASSAFSWILSAVSWYQSVMG